MLRAVNKFSILLILAHDFDLNLVAVDPDRVRYHDQFSLLPFIQILPVRLAKRFSRNARALSARKPQHHRRAIEGLEGGRCRNPAGNTHSREGSSGGNWAPARIAKRIKRSAADARRAARVGQTFMTRHC